MKESINIRTPCSFSMLDYFLFRVRLDTAYFAKN